MDAGYKPKFSFGKIRSKHLILDIFSWGHQKEDLCELFWEFSKSFRTLIVENYKLLLQIESYKTITFGTFELYHDRAM